jgi:hypothetical protein
MCLDAPKCFHKHGSVLKQSNALFVSCQKNALFAIFERVGFQSQNLDKSHFFAKVFR